MALILNVTYTGGTYVHSPQPEIVMTRGSIMDEDGTKRVGTREVWAIRGTIIGTSIADIKTKLTALETAYATATKLQNMEGVTPRETLDAAASRDGLLVVGVNYPEGNKAEYASKRRYDVTVTGEDYDGGEKGDPEILWLEETTTYAWDQHGKYTRTIQGRLRTADGVSADGKFATVTPSIPAGTNRMRYSKETNDDDDEMSYSFVDQEYWQAWPTNVTGGQAVTSTSLGMNGILRKTVSGRFIGGGAQGRADDEKLGSIQYRNTSEQQDVNPYDGSVSFRYDYIDLVNSDTDLIAFNETTTVEYASQDFVILEALDGAVPVRQDTIIPAARARQSGSAVGASDWPAFPDPLWALPDLKPPKTQTYGGKDLMPDGKYTNYRLSWSYSFLFAENPTHHKPNSA